MANGYHVEATTPPSQMVKVVHESGMVIATIVVDQPRHSFADRRYVRHPYNGVYLASVRVKRGKAIEPDDIVPTDATGNRLDGDHA